MKERLGTLEKDHIALPNFYTVNFSLHLSPGDLQLLPRVTMYLTKGNNKICQELLDTESELILIPVFSKRNYGLSEGVGTCGGQVVNGILASVHLTVGLVDLQIHVVGISPVSACMTGTDILSK